MEVKGGGKVGLVVLVFFLGFEQYMYVCIYRRIWNSEKESVC